MKLIRILNWLYLIVALTAIESSCLAQTKKAVETKHYRLSLIVITNGSCAFKYEVDSLGNAVLNLGYSNNYMDSVLVFSSDKIKQFKYKIKGKQNIAELNGIVNKLASAEVVKGQHNADAWHCMVFINNMRKIDVYGTMESKELFKIIQKVACCKKARLEPNRCIDELK